MLTAEQFQLITKTLRGSSMRVNEKRASPRVGIRAKVPAVVMALDDTGVKRIDLTIRDLSRTGMGFSTTQSIQPDTNVILRLPRAATGRGSTHMLAKVLYVVQVRDSIWQGGLQLLSEISETQAMAIEMGKERLDAA